MGEGRANENQKVGTSDFGPSLVDKVCLSANDQSGESEILENEVAGPKAVGTEKVPVLKRNVTGEVNRGMCVQALSPMVGCCTIQRLLLPFPVASAPKTRLSESCPFGYFGFPLTFACCMRLSIGSGVVSIYCVINRGRAQSGFPGTPQERVASSQLK